MRDKARNGAVQERQSIVKVVPIFLHTVYLAGHHYTIASTINIRHVQDVSCHKEAGVCNAHPCSGQQNPVETGFSSQNTGKRGIVYIVQNDAREVQLGLLSSNKILSILQFKDRCGRKASSTILD